MTKNSPTRADVIALLQKMARDMAEIWPPYSGYGPSSSHFRERMPAHWPKIQALIRRMGGGCWADVLRAADLRVPSRGMMIEYAHAHKKQAAVWEEREEESNLLMPPGGGVRCWYDNELPLIERGQSVRLLRRLDDQHVLIRISTVYEVR